MPKHKKSPPKRIPVKPHDRASPTRRPPAAPMPGPNEFSPEQETAMRRGTASARMAPPPMGDGDDDDLGGI